MSLNHDSDGTSRICPICLVDSSGSFETVLFRSTVCGHPTCSACLVTRAGARLATGVREIVWADQNQQVACLICTRRAPLSAWVSIAQVDATNDRETKWRNRVFAVWNDDRSRFATDEEYDAFVERREELVYSLLTGDSQTRATLLTELATLEAAQQARILENITRMKRRDEERIRNIVEKEGIFFELISRDFKAGFAPRDTRRVCHPLKRAWPELFKEDAHSSNALSSSGASGIGASGSDGSGVILGAVNGPLPVDKTEASRYVPGKPLKRVDTRLHMIAGGHRKETVQRRMIAEACSVRLTGYSS